MREHAPRPPTAVVWGTFGAQYILCVCTPSKPHATPMTSYFSILQYGLYYHLRSTVKRERFFAHVHFSNETVSQTTVSTGPMKMFRLGHETMNVCQRNMARFGHVEYMFDKVNNIFQGFGSLVSL